MFLIGGLSVAASAEVSVREPDVPTVVFEWSRCRNDSKRKRLNRGCGQDFDCIDGRYLTCEIQVDGAVVLRADTRDGEGCGGMISTCAVNHIDRLSGSGVYGKRY